MAPHRHTAVEAVRHLSHKRGSRSKKIPPFYLPVYGEGDRENLSSRWWGPSFAVTIQDKATVHV
jgi:hypothetical protein